MIGLLLALGLSSASIAPPEAAMVENLRSCAPKSEREALRCIDHYLPRTIRRSLVGTRQPQFDSDDQLGRVLQNAWGLDSEKSLLSGSYRKEGFPIDELRYKPSVLIRESYWLDKRGCAYSRRDRVRDAADYVKEDRQAFLGELRYLKDNPGGAADSFNVPRRLKVNCTGWEPEAR